MDEEKASFRVSTQPLLRVGGPWGNLRWWQQWLSAGGNHYCGGATAQLVPGTEGAAAGRPGIPALRACHSSANPRHFPRRTSKEGREGTSTAYWRLSARSGRGSHVVFREVDEAAHSWLRIPSPLVPLPPLSIFPTASPRARYSLSGRSNRWSVSSVSSRGCSSKKISRLLHARSLTIQDTRPEQDYSDATRDPPNPYSNSTELPSRDFTFRRLPPSDRPYQPRSYSTRSIVALKFPRAINWLARSAP